MTKTPMPKTRAEKVVSELLAGAGVTVGGPEPWDLHVHDPRFFVRLLGGGSLALGESYMDGWWDAPALDQCLERLLRANLREKIEKSARLAVLALEARVTNMQSVWRSWRVAEKHYGIGNDFYEAMLDKKVMAYTCGYWRNARTLEEAQEAKVDLACRKIGLTKGMTLLELGCGWGGFARHAAERYGSVVTALTNSKEMASLAADRCRGLSVTVRNADYRQAEGLYDRVVAIGIAEHIGPKNYRTLMEVAHRSLNEDGLFLLHTITNNESFGHAIPWVHKYIFPDAVAPSTAQLGRAMEKLFVVEDLQNFGPDYAPTLLAWYENFRSAWPRFKERYGERFYRMWSFYLLGSAAVARARDAQVFQIVLSKTGRAHPDCRMS
jgi:cyclopropane-fatty-acyl-phospholipid synthase